MEESTVCRWSQQAIGGGLEERMRGIIGAIAAIGIGVLISNFCYADVRDKIRNQNEAAAGEEVANDQAGTEETSVFDLRTGDCISEGVSSGYVELENMTLVSCSDPRASQRVTLLFAVPDDGQWPGLLYLDSQAAIRCPESTSWYLGPTEESWKQDDRTVICLAVLG